MQRFRINGHPDPYIDESARGYLLRIVDINGFKNVENICRKAGTKFAHKSHVMTNQWERIFEVFTPVLHKKEPLINMFEQHWTAKLYATFNMKVSNLFSVNCRICPSCITENGYVKADWDFALQTVCTKHKCNLIDSCPHCDTAITWRRGELSTCKACDKSYSSAPMITLDNSHALFKLNKSLPTLNIGDISQLIIALARAHRPHDNMLSCPSIHLMSLNEINALLTHALGLMHSTGYREQYKYWLEETRAKFSIISRNATQEPYRAFTASYTGKLDNRFPKIAFIPPEHTINIIYKRNIIKPLSESSGLGVQTARLNNVSDDIKEIDLSSQIDTKRLASVLRVPSPSIQHMVDGGILRPINSVNTTRHNIFDLDDIVTLIKSVTVQEAQDSSKLLLLKSLADGKLLSKFALQFHHVIEAILHQEIDVFFNHEDDGIFDACVDKNKLIKVLEGSMQKASRSLNIIELASILNTSPQCIDELAELKVIKMKTVHQKKGLLIKSLTGESALHLFSKYISLNRMSYFAQVRIDKLLRLLKIQGIEPTITVTDGKAPLYLVEHIPESEIHFR